MSNEVKVKDLQNALILDTIKRTKDLNEEETIRVVISALITHFEESVDCDVQLPNKTFIKSTKDYGHLTSIVRTVETFGGDTIENPLLVRDIINYARVVCKNDHRMMLTFLNNTVATLVNLFNRTTFYKNEDTTIVIRVTSPSGRSEVLITNK